MSRVIWLTDLHLNHCDPDAAEHFLRGINRDRPDAVLISGDFCESQLLEVYLRQIDRILECAVYFVLGNHDFYHSSVRAVRKMVRSLDDQLSGLHYLSAMNEPAKLTDTTGLVGHDGWSDGRIGDYKNSTIYLNDYQLIEDLANLDKAALLKKLNQLGDEAADHIRDLLPECLEQFDQTFLLTHVPPFREACWHEEKTTDDNWAPHFTCKASGDAILEIMRERPEKKLTVLCGHCHSDGIAQPLENVTVLTGGAVYGEPAVAKVFEF